MCTRGTAGIAALVIHVHTATLIDSLILVWLHYQCCYPAMPLWIQKWHMYLHCLVSFMSYMSLSWPPWTIETSMHLVYNVTVIAYKHTHIYPQVGHCRSLHILSLRENEVEELPEEVGQLEELTVLDIVGNRSAWWLDQSVWPLY